MIKHQERLKYEFTHGELMDLGSTLAQSTAKWAALEQQKKEVDAQLKSEIEAQKTNVQRASACINAGYEYRITECRVEMDNPRAGQKTIIRLDTGEVVRVIPMTDDDRQRPLFDSQAEEREEDAPPPPQKTEPAIEGKFPKPDANGTFTLDKAEQFTFADGITTGTINILQIDEAEWIGCMGYTVSGRSRHDRLTRSFGMAATREGALANAVDLLMSCMLFTFPNDDSGKKVSGWAESLLKPLDGPDSAPEVQE